MSTRLETKKKTCIACDHDMQLHDRNGRCAVMLDDVDSCPCGSSC